MANSPINRYVWLIDVIRRHKRITRKELDRLWRLSDFSQGDPLPRRTFYSYRQAISEIFNVEIAFDPATYEYYLNESENISGLTEWLLNTASTNDSLTNASEIRDKIFLEDTPSARDYLSPAIEALKNRHIVRLDYLPYYRTIATKGIVMKPLFLKIFRQRWYLTGRVEPDGKIKTYALDRVKDFQILSERFEESEEFDPEDFLKYAFGVVFTEGPVHRVVLKVSPREAKYLRALPLHGTQEEIIHDAYSLFIYRMRLTPDLVSEILSRGPRVQVMEPPELRLQVEKELQEALKAYEPGADK